MTNHQTPMTNIEQAAAKAFDAGREAAVRGCYRILCLADSPQEYAAWYTGYDSVPPELRGIAPLTGPIPAAIRCRIDVGGNG
jgi:hypothetical protein